MKEVDIETAGTSRTTNPTPTVDGGRMSPMFDKVGRQVMTLHHARDLIRTATVSDLQDGTTTVLTAGASGNFLDLVYLTAANDSDASIQLTILDDGTTVHTLDIPGGSTVQMNPSIPIPQSAKGATWYVKLQDVTGTTVDIEALFVHNV